MWGGFLASNPSWRELANIFSLSLLVLSLLCWLLPRVTCFVRCSDQIRCLMVSGRCHLWQQSFVASLLAKPDRLLFLSCHLLSYSLCIYKCISSFCLLPAGFLLPLWSWGNGGAYGKECQLWNPTNLWWKPGGVTWFLCGLGKSFIHISHSFISKNEMTSSYLRDHCQI